MHRDNNRRTALHLATLKGKPGVVGKSINIINLTVS